MRKYLFSLLVQDVSWPSHKGELTFESLGNISVSNATGADSPVKWTSSIKLELILSNLAYHHVIQLENAVMGRLDVFARSKTRDISSEIDIMVLLREFKVFFFGEMSLAENFLPGTFAARTIKRFSIEDWYWDSKLGGFIKEENTPFDLSVPNQSIVYSNSDAWSAELEQKIVRVPIEHMPTTMIPARGLSMRTSCNLIIDDAALPVDYRILNMDLLNSIDFLRITPPDYLKWIVKCSVAGEARDDPHSFVNTRKAIDLARQNGKYCVNPMNLQWRSASWNQKTLFECDLPSADWRFIVFVNHAAWANMLPHTQVSIRYGCPNANGLMLTNAIRLQMEDVRGLTIRSHFVAQTPAERHVATQFAGHDLQMQSFGLHFINGKWSSKPSMLSIHKQNHSLGSNMIDVCFEGFAKDEAHKLTLEKRECPVCSVDITTSLLDNCGHTFCEQCIKSHVAFGGDSCPICRESLKSWTTIKRATSRKRMEEHLSKKLYLEDMALDDAIIIVPNALAAEVIESWISPEIDRISLDSHNYYKKKYSSIILLSSIVKTAREVARLHQIFQTCTKDGTVFHILMDEGFNPTPQWLDDFAACYKGLVQVSEYR